MGALQWWRTGLGPTHDPGDGTAAGHLQLVVLSLLQSWGRLGHWRTVSTLTEKSGTVDQPRPRPRHQLHLLERSTVRPDQRRTLLASRDRDTGLGWAAVLSLSPPLRDSLGSLAHLASYLLARGSGAEDLAILEESDDHITVF